jgi:hypothetical protein
MDSKAQLKTLYEYRQRLQKISDCSSATLQLRDERLYKIENEIIQLESFAQSLQDGIECLNTFKAVDAWQNSFLRQIERFQDTTFHEELEMASKRVHQILEIFKELELISGKASSNFQEATAYVNKILEIQDSAKSWLGSEQKQLIDRVLQGVNQHVQQKVAEARQWLLTLTSDFEKGAFVKVTEKIKLPPEFFPESERLKLTELTIRVQQKMDQDVVTRIEMQFREITDPSTRQACLNRLKQIFDENF